MQRWIVSFVVVVAAVAVFLYLSDPSKPEPDSTPERRPPQRPLEDGEVRRYIAVMTEFPAQLRAVGDAFEVARRAALEKGETLDEAAMSASSSAKWDAFFSRHQISRDGFNELRTRVEYVVDSLRDEATT
ncbi:MAG: hypothetical protein OER88_03110, partial [Planctomycetota bacterium]|nr:hypothetical protein [Planctomycetota bacterium]